MNYQFRPFEEADLPGCLQLWSENTEWGVITAEQWRSWFYDTPYGPALVTVATDERNQIVGQLVFTPVLVQVGNRTVRGMRLSAPILKQDLRLHDLKRQDHPVIRLLQAGVQAAALSDVQLFYAMPAKGWLSFFRWMKKIGIADVQQASFGCLARPLKPSTHRQAASISRHLTCHIVEDFSHGYYDLWCAARSTWPISCGVVREPSLLRYRNGGHLNVQVDNHGKLLGFISIIRSSGLIADILAHSIEDVGAILQAATAFLASARDSSPCPDELKSIDSPLLGSVLRENGFEPVDYEFAFICYAHHSHIVRDDIAPARWHLTGGD